MTKRLLAQVSVLCLLLTLAVSDCPANYKLDNIIAGIPIYKRRYGVLHDRSILIDDFSLLQLPL